MCINCSSEVTSIFCPTCGQRQTVKRLSVKEGWNDFWARVYGFDGMFPRTLRDLTIRPGEVSRKYIKGNRVAYYGPVGYFFLMVTLMYIVASVLNIDLVEFMKSAGDMALQPKPKSGSGQERVFQATMKLASDNLKILSFIMIPIFAFCGRYIFFRKQGFNFIEQTVLPFYMQGHTYWLSIFSLCVYALCGKFIPAWILSVATIIFFSYAYSNMFKSQGKVKAFLKGMGIYLTTQIIFSLLLVIGLIILLNVNPDIYEALKPSNNR